MNSQVPGFAPARRSASSHAALKRSAPPFRSRAWITTPRSGLVAMFGKREELAHRVGADVAAIRESGALPTRSTPLHAEIPPGLEAK